MNFLMRRIYGLFLFVIWFSISSQVFAVSANDISVLVPLPNEVNFAQMLSPQDQGAQGILIPEKIFAVLPQLVPEYENTVTYRDQLKAVGIRIDPCFVEGVGPWSCRQQIRIVWQPVLVAAQTVTTRDAAVHTFYDFDPVAFQSLWQRWKALSSGDPGEPLQIHPRLAKEGLEGPYWQSLKKLILENCGEKNLTRITAMNVMSGEQLWIFMGFEVQQGQTSPIEIARIQRPSQGVIISSPGFKHFNGKVMPPPKQDPDFVNFVADSISVKKYFSEEQIKTLMGKIIAYENPQTHNPGTLDCVSCHVAQSAVQWGKSHFSQWNWDLDFAKDRYPGGDELSNVTQGPLRTNLLRAFGYFHNQPAISQRVINESAANLRLLQQEQAAK